jgi:hypothetical protein
MLAFPDIERVYWYGWKDYPSTVADQVGKPQRGLVRADGSPKPALQVLPHLIRHTNGSGQAIPAGRVAAWRFGWPRAAETHIIAYATGSQAAQLTVAIVAGRRASLRSFPLAAVMAGQCCSPRVVELRAGRLELNIGPDPVFVEVGP